MRVCESTVNTAPVGRSASSLKISLDLPLEEKLRTTLETSRAFEQDILQTNLTE